MHMHAWKQTSKDIYFGVRPPTDSSVPPKPGPASTIEDQRRHVVYIHALYVDQK